MYTRPVISTQLCPITGIQFELFVIEYPGDLHMNYVKCFNGFLCFTVFKSYLKKVLQMFLLKRSSQKTILHVIPKFVVDTIYS